MPRVCLTRSVAMAGTSESLPCASLQTGSSQSLLSLKLDCQAQVSPQRTSKRRINAGHVCAQRVGHVPAQVSAAAAGRCSRSAARRRGRLVGRPDRALDAPHCLCKLPQLYHDLHLRSHSLSSLMQVLFLPIVQASLLALVPLLSPSRPPSTAAV